MTNKVGEGEGVKKKSDRRIYITHYVTDHMIWYLWWDVAVEAEGQLMINSQNIDVRVEMQIFPPKPLY